MGGRAFPTSRAAARGWRPNPAGNPGRGWFHATIRRGGSNPFAKPQPDTMIFPLFMLEMLFKPFAGRHYRKFLEAAKPIVARANELEKSYQSLTDDQLRAKTDEFRARLKAGETLDQILPEAFATVKNAARRLVGRKMMVCDHELTWDMVHFDVQLIGGLAIHQGKIAEMATGEGKTLVSTLPLYLNSLNGRNTQLVTVNDYLARRDSEWMGFLYNFLGVSVGCIQQQMAPDLRREMYGRDITYGTASEFGFDYLRDN